MTDSEKIDALQKQLDELQALVEDVINLSIAMTRSDRRRHLNLASGHETTIQYLTQRVKSKKTAMTGKNGNGSLEKGENDGE